MDEIFSFSSGDSDTRELTIFYDVGVRLGSHATHEELTIGIRRLQAHLRRFGVMVQQQILKSAAVGESKLRRTSIRTEHTDSPFVAKAARQATMVLHARHEPLDTVGRLIPNSTD
jgi:hypothetical protein